MRVKGQAGFTLVELTVTMLLVSIVGLMVSNFIVQWLQASALAQARTALLQTAQTTLDTVAEDIRLSGNADLKNRWPDQNLSPDQFAWQSTGQTLVLAKAAVNQSNVIIFSDPAKYISEKNNIIYYRTGDKLYRRVIASPVSGNQAKSTCAPAAASASCSADRLVATGVTSFSVAYYDAGNALVTPADAHSIQLAISLSGKAGSKTISAQYNTRMVFRNE